MKNILFAKYNRTRREEYQLSTLIYEDATGRHVEKAALNKKAVQHIQDFQKYYSELAGMHKSVKLLKPNVLNDKVIFNFVQGITVDNYLMNYISDITLLVDQIKILISKIYVYNEEYVIDFYAKDEFIKVFGNVGSISSKAIKISNIDIIFDNIIIQNETLFCLDYEWVFDFPVPIDYIIYRSLLYFYNKYSIYISRHITQEEFFSKFDFTIELQDKYWKMEDNFQQYVQGKDRCNIYLNNYTKKTKTLHDLLDAELQLINKIEYSNDMIKEVELKENHIKNLEHILLGNDTKIDEQTDEINQAKLQCELKDNHIKNLEQEIELTNTHVKNLEGIMHDKDLKINDQNDVINQEKLQNTMKDNHINNLENIITSKDDYIEEQKNILNQEKLKNEFKDNQIINLENQIMSMNEHLKDVEAILKKSRENPLFGLSLWLKK